MRRELRYDDYHQCGHRPWKSNIDQIFTLRQILEKAHENQDKTHSLFVDFKAAFDSPVRDHVYAAMSDPCEADWALQNDVE